MNIRGCIENASRVVLTDRVKLYGDKTFTIATNFLNCRDMNCSLESLADECGMPVGPESFKCGTEEISPYDLGLLYSTFMAISTAFAHSGGSVRPISARVDKENFEALWIDSYLLLYSRKDNVIIPVPPAEVLQVLRNKRERQGNFCDLRTFELSVSGKVINFETAEGKHLCAVDVANHVITMYPTLFSSSGDIQTIEDDPNTTWDERSELGALINAVVGDSAVESALGKYSSKVILDSVVVRDDLIMIPTKRYSRADRFLGSICYTDKEEVALAVNIRNGLFVYKPWFPGSDKTDIITRSNPDLTQFYDVTEECTKIEVFSKTSPLVPLTSAQLDSTVFSAIKDKFFAIELPRVKLANTFGRVVIPEPVLLKALHTNYCSAYCIVPVGSIGSNLICKNSEGFLYSIGTDASAKKDSWDLCDAFYDITEVIM